MVTRTKTSAKDVAGYLILLAAADEESEYLSPMRLQKLLYYVQGWHLARAGHPIFGEKLKAWANGPVVPQVWHQFRNYGREGISLKESSNPQLSDGEKLFIDRVWDIYKDYSAISLSKMTHEEPPWKEARNGLLPEESSDKEITQVSMRRYFKSIDATD